MTVFAIECITLVSFDFQCVGFTMRFGHLPRKDLPSSCRLGEAPIEAT